MKPIRGSLLSVLGGVLALLATAGPSWAAFPGANGLIAYSERVGISPSSSEIFTIPPTGGDPTRLTDNAIADADPSWSADGRRLAFIRGDVYYGPTDVWTMRADGTHQRQVTHGGAHETSPSFSPGGGRIVMARNGRIVVARTDGTESVRLTHDWAARDPAFSPNGRRIVFAGAPGKERPLGIWVMRRDGTHKRLLRDNGNTYHPDFDPDGSHIVFERCIDDGHECLTDDMLMRSNGRHKRVIEGAGGEEPVFSPNGRRIAVVRRFDCVDLYDLCGSRVFSVARRGGDARVVTQRDAPLDGFTHFPLDSSPSWQPIPRP